MTRNFKFAVTVFIFLIGAFELQSWLFATLASRFGILHFYPPDLFSRITDEQLSRNLENDLLGWPSGDAPRPSPSETGTICGSAFGDSFTFGGEVADDEVWVHQLSRLIGCTIVNYGVGGYGVDQAVLRHERMSQRGIL